MKPFSLFLLVGGATAMALGASAEGCASSADTGGIDASIPSTSGTGTGTGVGTSGDSGGLPIGTGTGTGTGTAPGSGTGVTSGTDASLEASPGSEAGADGSTGVGSDAGSGLGSDSGDSGTGSGSGSCHRPPTPLHPETMAGVYCPFSSTGVGDAGNLTCTASEHCCEPAAGTATCVASGTACATGDTDWTCQGTLDCAGTAGTVCCGTGTINMQAACGAFPQYPYISKFTGTACLAACNTMTNSYQVCSQDSECPGGATGSCVAIEPKGGGIGYCQ